MDGVIETKVVKRRGRPPKIRTDAPQNLYDAEEMAAFLQHQATRLGAALRIKASVHDSDSRQQELANQREAIIEAVILDLRTKSHG